MPPPPSPWRLMRAPQRSARWVVSWGHCPLCRIVVAPVPVGSCNGITQQECYPPDRSTTLLLACPAACLPACLPVCIPTPAGAVPRHPPGHRQPGRRA
jgi:hypothetical protein